MNIKVVNKPEQDKRLMRDVLADCFYNFAETRPNVIYLDADLISSLGMSKFHKDHPDKVIQCGIQEANMIGVAGGLSAVGFIPFTHTFGAFAARRVADQVFLSVAYAGNEVKMIGSDPGITAATNGGTHTAFEDISIMRAIPKIRIVEPTDTVMLGNLLPKIADSPGPFYIRLTRKEVMKIYEEGSDFEIGKSAQLREGSDLTLIGSGLTVAECLRAHDILREKNISARIIDMYTIKPVDVDSIVKAAKETGAILTAENHNIHGGLGSAVAETLVENFPVPMQRVGSADEFGEVGPVSYLKQRFGLTGENIAQEAEKLLRRKQRI
ncbi:MAG: transketolase family protein [Oscillospiraceae bacterium]|jgi:transketolase